MRFQSRPSKAPFASLMTLLTATPTAAAIALVAYRAGTLTASGAVAAWAVGLAALLAGWRWAVILLVFFVAGSAISAVGAARKEQVSAGIVAKLGARDAWQVLANGAVFAVCAAGSLAAPHPGWWVAAAGALTAAAADTFSTEVGTLGARPPRSIVSWAPVPPGTSGGVSAAGTAGGALGALLIALPAALLSASGAWAVAVLLAAGVFGSLVDSVAGATLQQRRWCSDCSVHTERIVHSCGSTTVHAGGLRWIRNDLVNLLATLSGALAALVLAAFVWG